MPKNLVFELFSKGENRRVFSPPRFISKVQRELSTKIAEDVNGNRLLISEKQSGQWKNAHPIYVVMKHVELPQNSIFKYGLRGCFYRVISSRKNDFWPHLIAFSSSKYVFWTRISHHMRSKVIFSGRYDSVKTASKTTFEGTILERLLDQNCTKSDGNTSKWRTYRSITVRSS